MKCIVNNHNPNQSSPVLRGKVAMVTGSTSGIGLSMAKSLALRGSDLVIHGFGDQATIDQIKLDFERKYNVKCHHFPTDLTKQDEVEKMLQEIAGLHPNGVDVLVNNAGFQHVSKVQEFPVEKWNDLIAVLLTAPFLLSRSLLPKMLEKGWGRIVNIASVHSLKASPFKAAYCSAKHGLAGLTKVIALETAGSGVTCNAISPGYVETPSFNDDDYDGKCLSSDNNLIFLNHKQKQFLSSFHPSKEAVKVEQLAEMCVFLCSDAGTQITGSNFVMDGGWNAK
ncbi:hypothetical protein HELRODRAFT_74885 [Helobdella robusta]|uniref:3-oxoacyl-[acyl-carrier-protein] reductase n=1 Tax=Helobdella robusta TaxID=6412 RepID=T1G1X1_HELRO|nr:hypothetical protein HELRODRAFT_74885 [Helobdella robusta]ESO08540.1 hypothetical protein HELRODRAFT_74885 [Helobdella robusta]